VQAGLWVLVGSRRGRLGALRSLAEEAHHIALVEVLVEEGGRILVGEEARHIVLEEVPEEGGDHNLAEEAHRIAGVVQEALHIVLEEARRNDLVVEEDDHILVGEVEHHIDLVVVGHSPVGEGDHRNRPVGAADRRSNQTCLLV